MEENYIDKFDIERITRGVEQEFNVEQVEKGQYTIEKADGTGSGPHVVDLKSLYCSCNDYEFNCSKKQSELGDVKACKHIYHCIFRVHSMI